MKPTIIFHFLYFNLCNLWILLLLLLFVPKWTSDGPIYYQYLRSSFFDHDLNFYNDHAFWDAPFRTIQQNEPFNTVPQTGYTPNPFSIGPALTWAPGVVLTWVGVEVWNRLGGEVINDGYSPHYLAVIALTSFLWAALGGMLLYRTLRRWFPEGAAQVGAVVGFLGSPALAAMVADATLSHALSFGTVSLFLYHCLREDFGEKKGDYALAGVFGGMMALARWQDVLFATVPVVIFARSLLSDPLAPWKKVRVRVNGVLFAALAFFVTFAPNMAVWKTIYGALFTIPQGGEALHFWEPRLLDLLFSLDHGLISWTPLMGLGMAGLVLAGKPYRRWAWLLLLPVALEWWVNAAYYHTGGGKGYGMRRMVNCVPAFGFGLAVLWVQAEGRRWRKWLLGLGAGVLVLWNLLLLGNYVRGPLATNSNPAQVLEAILLAPVSVGPQYLVAAVENAYFGGGLLKDCATGRWASMAFKGALLAIAIIILIWLQHMVFLERQHPSRWWAAVPAYTLAVTLAVVAMASSARMTYAIGNTSWKLHPGLAPEAVGMALSRGETAFPAIPLAVHKTHAFQGFRGDGLAIRSPATASATLKPSTSPSAAVTLITLCEPAGRTARVSGDPHVADLLVEGRNGEKERFPLVINTNTGWLQALGTRPPKIPTSRVKRLYGSIPATWLYRATFPLPHPFKVRRLEIVPWDPGVVVNLQGAALEMTNGE